MTDYGTEMFAAFRNIRRNTIRIAQEIPERHDGFRAAADASGIVRMGRQDQP